LNYEFSPIRFLGLNNMANLPALDLEFPRIPGLILVLDWARILTAMTTTVDRKGSVPLPQEVLRDSDVHPGDELDVSAEGEHIILRKVPRPPPEGLLEILHSLKGLPIPQRSRSPMRDVQL
jgi:AbrB family looped-hinge helix DNA binding protein